MQEPSSSLLSAPAGQTDAPARHFEPPALEALYADARELLLHPRRREDKVLWLMVSLGLFVLASLGSGQTAVSLAIIVGVLVVHELGHFVAMRAFGYSDVSIYFIPFLGAATVGNRRGAASWKAALVLLAGPVPGVLAGAVLLALGGDSALLRTVGLLLLVVNGLNLLPVHPLDGGQLFQQLVFSRVPAAELAFAAASSATVILVGLWWSSGLLVVLGFLTASGLRMRWQISAAGRQLAHEGFPPNASALDDRQLRALFETAHAMTSTQTKQRAKFIARLMERLHQAATLHPPSPRATAALLTAWAAAAVLTLAAVR